MNKEQGAKSIALFAMVVLLFSGSGFLFAQTTRNLTEAEWRLMIDRINLLVDNHFNNRDFSEAENANWNITGLSVGVYQNGRTAFFSRGYHESAQRNVRNRTPVTENSIFAIGSLSKPVSTIMFSYFSRINNPATGRPYVNLNDPVNRYFPTRPFIDTDGTAVHPTLLQFVTHYGGTPRHLHYNTFAEFKSLLANLTYTHKPGTAYSYSMGAAVVANIVASLYYKDFPNRRVNDLLQELLFRPLGMNSTKLHGWIDPAMRDRMTMGHRFNGAPVAYHPVTSGTLIGASGEISSTARDMMRLAAFILGDGVPQGSVILQQAAAAGIAWNTGNRSVPNTALSPHESNVSTLGGRFRELFTRPSNPGRYGRYLQHGGLLGGHMTYMILCPDTKTAVVVLVNNTNARGSLAAQIIDRALNATYSGRRTAFDDFDDHVASYAGANANVDIALNESLTITGAINNIRTPAREGTTLTIRSANPNRPVTLTRGTTGVLFDVPNGATLIFRDIIIDGGGNTIFSEEDDDDEDDYDEDGNLVSKAPAALGGALVRVNSGGTFIMESGAVLRNNVNTTNSGGGVRLTGSGTFTMRGGSITGNASGNYDGGGVFAGNTSTFTMSGGEISGNTAVTSGGGVRVYNSAVFTMRGGKINGNIASNGGGVYADSASAFTMNGGEINSNTATSYGGGMRLSNSAVFTMNGGKISGNNALYGGGLYTNASNSLTMSGGEISGNTVASYGGGIYAGSTSTFTMTGGQISGNNASGGNGVRMAGTAVFNQYGGVVAGTGTNTTAVVSIVSNAVHNTNGVPNNAVIIAWNRPTGTLNYTVGSSTNLTVSSGATAVWANQGGTLGVSYTNGRNTGWIRAW